MVMPKNFYTLILVVVQAYSVFIIFINKIPTLESLDSNRTGVTFFTLDSFGSHENIFPINFIRKYL